MSKRAGAHAQLEIVSTRLARGSVPPTVAIERSDWLQVAIRARFPKLAAALGDRAFEAMLGGFMTHKPAAQRSLSTADAELPRYLTESCGYPVWYAELAALDRAHCRALHAPAVTVLSRRTLTSDTELKLIPAHALVSLTTTVDELWCALDDAAEFQTRARAKPPRALDWPRTVLIWRKEGSQLAERTVDPDESAALHAAVRGTSLAELAAGLGGYNPHARALDVVLRWIDDGVLVGRGGLRISL
jgi:hypothetical protein